MKAKIKGLLLFVAGVGIGSFVTRALIKKKYEDLIDEEIASVREHLTNKKEVVEESEECVDENGMPYKKYPVENTPKTPLDVRRERVTRENYNNLTSIYKTDPAELEHPMDDDEDYDCSKNRGDMRAPYVISLGEFNEEMNHFDKTTIYFYEDDEVLTEENEEVINNVNDIVGRDSLEKFGCMSEDPEVVYVRNEKLGIDYEVIRLSRSYAETVLGAGGMR